MGQIAFSNGLFSKLSYSHLWGDSCLKWFRYHFSTSLDILYCTFSTGQCEWWRISGCWAAIRRTMYANEKIAHSVYIVYCVLSWSSLFFTFSSFTCPFFTSFWYAGSNPKDPQSFVQQTAGDPCLLARDSILQ